MTDLTDPMFHDEDAARAHLEHVRWAGRPFCPHCGETVNVTRMQGHSHRPGLFQCNSCRDNFSVTVGTVMESSHIPLCKWVMAFHLMASSKKGVSSLQLSRMLDITYKSAWFMGHRIREAMNDPMPAKLGGEGKIIEADETYHGKSEIKPRRKYLPPPTKSGRGGPAGKRTVIALVERGGEARAVAMTGQRVTSQNVREILIRHADRKSRLHTDESNLYPVIGVEFATHETVLHAKKEYARGDVTTNSVEGFFGVFKRGFNGIYQHCGEQHFQRYLDEFTFRYNTRIKLGYNDDMRAVLITKGAEGKRLTYRGTCSA